MTSTLFILALVVFLVGVASGIFAVLIISIHRGQRTQFLSHAPERRTGATARRMLIGIRDDNSGEEEWTE